MAIKLKGIFFTCLVLSVGLQFCFSQELKPKLVDSVVGPSNCEFARYGALNLVDELEKIPDSIGYIVIKQKKGKSKGIDLWGHYHQDIISVQIKKTNINPNRLRIIRAEAEEYRIDFYLASDESSKPDFTEAKWDLDIPSKPLMFDDGTGGQLCEETPFRLSIFSEILTAYPKAQGHFVIYGESFSKDFSKEKKRVTNEIIKAGIPLNRFRFFFRKDNSTIDPYAKLWLVPNNRK